MNKKIAKKIFVVDDDEMLSMALEDYLTRKTPHEVYLFSTGEECLQHLHALPDIIILDYHLNSVARNAENGIKILEQIKSHAAQIKVIMLSGKDIYKLAIQTGFTGADEYVIKDEQAFDNIVSLCNN